MSVKGVLDDLKTQPDSRESFKLLGDLLRQESVRASPEIKSSLIELVEYANKNMSQFLKHPSPHSTDLILEILRCMVNLLADSDENRFYFQSSQPVVVEFWRLISSALQDPSTDVSINRRSVIILGQFIHSAEHKQQYLEWVFNSGFGESLLVFLTNNFGQNASPTDVFSYQNVFELLKEVYQVNSKALLENPAKSSSISLRTIDYMLEKLADLLENLTKFDLRADVGSQEDEDEDDVSDLEDLDEIVLAISDILTYMVSYEDLSGIDDIRANTRVMALIGQVPAEFPNRTHIKRKLFSVSGCISSMSSFSSLRDLDASVEYFASTDAVDPYVLAASAINLGNYITSAEKRSQVCGIVEKTMSLEAFIRSFFRIPINDVVQIQAIHLLNNLITEDSVQYVIDNYERLFSKFIKIIVDNGQYYADIYKIFDKFAQKLIKLHFINNQDNILDFIDIWTYIIQGSSDSQDIELLLLQAYVKLFRDTTLTSPHTEKVVVLLRTLVNSSVVVPGSGPMRIDTVLEKLKTIGIFNHNLTSHHVKPDDLINYLYDGNVHSLATQYLTPFCDFLTQLFVQLSDTNKPPHCDILLNNAKFVSATTLGFWSAIDNSAAKPLLEVCQQITRL